MKKLISLLIVSVMSIIITMSVFGEEAAPSYTQEEGDGILMEEPQEAVITPGLVRNGIDLSSQSGDDTSLFRLFSASELCREYNIQQTNDLPLYEPANAQPLNICPVVHSNCYLATTFHDVYNIYKVSDLEESLDYSSMIASAQGDHTMNFFFSEVKRICQYIADDSYGTLQFVEDPDDADILLTFCVSYPFYNYYYADNGSGGAISAYSCTITLLAIQLTNYENYTRHTAGNYPDDQVTISPAEFFTMSFPNIKKEDLTNFTNTVLSWYGYGAVNGTYSYGVQYAQQFMIDRGFMEGTADGRYGYSTEEAVNKVREYYGTEPAGYLDLETLINLYYGDVNDLTDADTISGTGSDVISDTISDTISGTGSDAITDTISDTISGTGSDTISDTGSDAISGTENNGQENQTEMRSGDGSEAGAEDQTHSPDEWGVLSPAYDKIPEVIQALKSDTYHNTLEKYEKGNSITPGMTGGVVQGVQQTLKDLGCDVNITWNADEETMNAVNRVLAAFGMEKTDVIDQDIYERLLIPALILEDEELAHDLIIDPEDPDGEKYFQYLKACILFAQEKYYSAKIAFKQSRYSDYQQRMDRCIQPYPETENGVLWSDENMSELSDMLSIKIIGVDDTKGVYLEICRPDASLALSMYTVGNGLGIAEIDSGVYLMKVAAGDEWYGPKEAFGNSGNYMFIYFDENSDWPDQCWITLEAGYDYSFYINADIVNAGVGITNWKNWMEKLPE